ncbi:hypothetical protein E8E13_008945 [Curvularia kusanoi]|uniref:Uncharacterized protein n=1 Tax=Curvularia kusanoi TaxID=90978 RepID=A0A9P4WA88_CURKU|nr:hypothetical protein E8E13_008945 [Curvularia kusanoi]
MAFRLLQHTLTAAILASTALAQASNIIPTDLTGGFSSEEVQVSFSASAVDGFASGTTFEKADVALEPTFALGDSNGISPTTLYTLVMLDTTCPNARKLHYVRSNFKFAFAGGTNIETESAPLLDYQAPGAFDEQGDDRQYVFLMYVNPQRSEFTQMQLPARGAVFDVERFQSDNGLDDAIAGVGMVVRLGGTADCGSEGGSEGPAESSSAALVSSTSATTPSATMSSTTSSTPSATSAPVPTQTSSLQASPTSAPPNNDGEGEEEDSSESGSEGGDEDGEDEEEEGGEEEDEDEDEEIPTPSTALPPTPTSTRTTTILRTDGAASPTSLSPVASPGTVGATGTASPTSSDNSVPQQTANAAAAGGVVGGRAMVVMSLFGIVLGLLW